MKLSNITRRSYKSTEPVIQHYYRNGYNWYWITTLTNTILFYPILIVTHSNQIVLQKLVYYYTEKYQQEFTAVWAYNNPIQISI